MAADHERVLAGDAMALRGRIASGAVDAGGVTDACLERISAVEDAIGAWTFLAPDYAREQARRLDLARKAGHAIGPLHGIPVGIKDIIDIAGMPTEHGSSLCRGNRPSTDAALVASLKRAGAVLPGKTVTTEFATYSPGKTRNPHHLRHTPGGSSSGSAAAVAAGMVPVAVGTQTNGSVIRPAAFCGVYGYKPTYGAIPRTGVLRQSPFLDQIGVFGRSVADLAMLAEAIFGDDPGDPATALRPKPGLLETAITEPPLRPNLAFAPTARWTALEADVQAAFEELIQTIRPTPQRIDFPSAFDRVWTWHGHIMHADIAHNLGRYEERDAAQLSEKLREQIRTGREVRAVDYAEARDQRIRLRDLLAEIFSAVDALITPATVSAAPLGLESTGDPSCCTLWTFLGVPAVTLPLLQTAEGLPIGVQLVGMHGDDARLLRTARWLSDTLGVGTISPIDGDRT